MIEPEEQIEARELIADCHHGVYIPQYICERYKQSLYDQGLKDACDICLNGPDCEEYWDAWDEIIRKFVVPIDLPGKWMLDHDDDLWAVRITN